MNLTAWCNQNSEQSQAPRVPVRIVQFQISPVIAGGNASVAGGKMVGQINLQNVPDALAAEFVGGVEVDVVITVKTPAPAAPTS